MSDNTIRMGGWLKQQVEAGKVDRLLQAGLAATFTVRACHEATRLVALFRPISADSMRIGGSVGLGLGALLGAGQAATSSYRFLGICKKSYRAWIAKSAFVERDELSKKIDEWVTIPAGTIEKQGKRALSYQSLLAAIDLETQSIKAASRSRDLVQFFIEFLRDGFCGGAASGVGFARVASELFGCAVNMPASGMAASLLGIAGGGLQVGLAEFMARQSGRALAASGAVHDRALADAEVLNALEDRSSPDEIAALLLYKGGEPGAVPMGKSPVAEPMSKNHDRAGGALAGCRSSKSGQQRDRGYRELAAKSHHNINNGANYDAFCESFRLSRWVLKQVLRNEEQFAVTAKADIALAKQRRFFGALLVSVGAGSLMLSLFLGGIVVAIATTIVAAIVMRIAAAYWTGAAALRLHRKLEAEAERNSDLKTTEVQEDLDAETQSDPEGIAQREKAEKLARRTAKVDPRIDSMMLVLRTADPDQKLGRKLLVKVLREHGISPTALRLLKVTCRHEAVLNTLAGTNRNAVIEADAMMRKVLRNLLTGDGARRAVGDKAPVCRHAAIPRAGATISTAPFTVTVATA